MSLVFKALQLQRSMSRMSVDAAGRKRRAISSWTNIENRQEVFDFIWKLECDDSLLTEGFSTLATLFTNYNQDPG
jgi:hypothetical protein